MISLRNFFRQVQLASSSHGYKLPSESYDAWELVRVCKPWLYSDRTKSPVCNICCCSHRNQTVPRHCRSVLFHKTHILCWFPGKQLSDRVDTCTRTAILRLYNQSGRPIRSSVVKDRRQLTCKRLRPGNLIYPKCMIKTSVNAEAM